MSQCWHVAWNHRFENTKTKKSLTQNTSSNTARNRQNLRNNTKKYNDFQSFYEQKQEFSSNCLLENIFSDFFDTKTTESVSEMNIFWYAFRFSRSISGFFFWKKEDYWYDCWNSDKSPKNTKKALFLCLNFKNSKRTTQKNAEHKTRVRNTPTLQICIFNYHIFAIKFKSLRV